MSFEVISIDNFDKQAKRLARKYRSLKSDLSSLATDLSQNPSQGTPIGHNCYKIRLAIKSKGKGKSGGARVITHVHITDTTVYLLSIYDKSEQSSITDEKILELIQEL